MFLLSPPFHLHLQTFVDNDGDDPSRVGDAFDPFSADGNQLSTTISFKDGGSGMARKLQRAAAAGGSRKERALVEGYSEITAFCDQTSLPKSVSDTAKQLYKQLADQKMLNGRARKEIVAACIFVACRTSGVSRTFKEIAAQAGIRVKALSKCFTALKGTFDLSQATNPAPLRPTKTATQSRAEPPRSTGPEVHLSRFINQLGLPPRYEFVCADIVRTACTYQDIGGRKPHTILGAAIFFTCHLLGTTIRLSEIRKVVDASDSTLKMAYRLFYDKQNALVKEEWITRGLARMDSLPPRAW